MLNPRTQQSYNFNNAAPPSYDASLPMERGLTNTMPTSTMPTSAPLQVQSFPSASGQGGAAFKVSVELRKLHELRDFKSVMPPLFKSRNVTSSDHHAIAKAMEDAQQANPFYNCANCECMYWWIPLGPVQMCMCFLNPCTYCIYEEFDKKKKEFNRIAPTILAKYGMKAVMKNDGLDMLALFDPA